MPTVVGVRLRFSAKTLWFDPSGTEPAVGDHVIVETERGTEFGTVAQSPFEVPEAELPAALKPVLRVATAEDIEFADELDAKAREAMPVFRELITERKLDMKPVNAEYLFDGDKVVFYFSAEERVDFRELVRDLASRLHARIDLRQIGVRDEARLVGGLGHCGEQLCCVRFGGDFQPVSIRMAKEQDLPLNPLKISGLCGRLMCCLRYEFDAYKDFKSRAPKRGSFVETPLGDAKVSDLNTPRETVTLRYQDGNMVTVPLGGMECGKGCGCPCKVSEEAFIASAPPAMLAASDLAPVAVEEAPPVIMTEDAPKEQSGRKRRRRRGGSGGGSGEADGGSKAKKAEQPKKAEPKKREPRKRGGGGGGKAAPEAAPKAAPAAEDAAAKSGGGRRRRRRRRGGGGGSGSSAPAAE